MTIPLCSQVMFSGSESEIELELMTYSVDGRQPLAGGGLPMFSCNTLSPFGHCSAQNFRVRRCSIRVKDDCEVIFQLKLDKRQANCEM